MTTKWSFAILPFLTLALLPLASQSQDESGAQQPQETPAVINPEQPVGQIAPNPATPPAQSPDQMQQSMRDHFRACSQALNQARDQAHTLSRDARQHASYKRETLDRQHVQVQEQIKSLKESREKFVDDLNAEQRNSIQAHIESMQQLHDRIQAHLQTIDQEFTGSNLHLVLVADEAKAAERDMKAYQKHLQETGKAFNLLSE